MRFIHTGDCHLGGWRQPELMELNMLSFSTLVDTAIREKVDFVLITGDLFDSAYPPIDIIKNAFNEFRRLKEANISVFIIAGSHDYSVSGKSFLDVLEKSGFAKNAFQPEERNGTIFLHPLLYKNVAIYGYPGKKSGLEVSEIARIKLHDAPGLFKILMLHTAIRNAVGTLPIPAVNEKELPKVDYLALSHLHVNYNRNGRVYSGPLFPNNSAELEELQGGSFYLVDTLGKIERRELKLKPVAIIEMEITNAATATDAIITRMKEENLKDKIVILRLSGIFTDGKVADIRFHEIEKQAEKQQAYVLLKNISGLQMRESEIKFQVSSENLEEDIIKAYQRDHLNDLNEMINPLFSALNMEKREDEKSQVFELRIMEEIKKIVKI